MYTAREHRLSHPNFDVLATLTFSRILYQLTCFLFSFLQLIHFGNTSEDKRDESVNNTVGKAQDLTVTPKLRNE
jgi:hypothetical protein